MKLTRPPGVTACPGRGEQGEQDSRNNRLRPEKFPWKGFRTGVRLSPPPPKRKDIRKDVLSFWAPTAEGGLRPSVIEMLGMAEPSLRRGFASGKTLVRRISAAGQKAGRVILLQQSRQSQISILTDPFQINGNCKSSCRLFWYSRLSASILPGKDFLHGTLRNS